MICSILFATFIWIQTTAFNIVLYLYFYYSISIPSILFIYENYLAGIINTEKNTDIGRGREKLQPGWNQWNNSRDWEQIVKRKQKYLFVSCNFDLLH